MSKRRREPRSTRENRSKRQRELRRRRNERAFLFDQEVKRCLGEADREQWESAISLTGGDVAEAARLCGIAGIPKTAKVLWGKSAGAAAETYRQWKARQRQR